ncbi:MAG: sigma 54-interacting transcriptional regulator [Anaerovorax sp.]|nr:sigma 54-interacting transcriptional regulator [Anaerovorax sp.]
MTNAKKTVVLIAGSEGTKKCLEQQLKDVLGEGIQIISYALDTGLGQIHEVEQAADIVLLSSAELKREMEEANLLTEGISYFVCRRFLQLDEIEQVITISKGQKVLFVNDAKETAETCIQNLFEIGVNHIEYVAWYPAMEADYKKEGKKPLDLSAFSIAITPGEVHMVPRSIGKIIDLKPRGLDLASLVGIAELIGVSNWDGNSVVRPYTTKIIEISKKMVLMNAETEVMRNLLKEKLQSKGYVAVHSFSNLLGTSPRLLEEKEKAKKLAKTDLTVLIEGESGTGKELFASSIHNASNRKNGPYVAANFSAFPEELMESELFGYEEGAFTGARKGGKRGLFEQADGGSIFLDEIGDISARMQTKLLRVLQEKEIMPLGGNNIKKVDIRVIAATNKNLKEMVHNGQFRADLYFRLKMGCIHLPTLREMPEEIKPLVKHFIKKELGHSIEVEDEVFNVFQKLRWNGNVRELYNTIKYMLAVRQKENHLCICDLPDTHFFEFTTDDTDHIKSAQSFANFFESISVELFEILQAVSNLQKQKRIAGRVNIARYLTNCGKHCTEGQVRTRLKQLEREDYLILKKGRSGASLTKKGEMVLEKMATK